MNPGGRMVEDMKRLGSLFAPLCAECGTMDELGRMLEDKKRSTRAHDLFDRIRTKTLAAIKDRNRSLECQYYFEEVCAQALYNLTGMEMPFDEDSPYWIIPNAFQLA